MPAHNPNAQEQFMAAQQRQHLQGNRHFEFLQGLLAPQLPIQLQQHRNLHILHHSSLFHQDRMHKVHLANHQHMFLQSLFSSFSELLLSVAHQKNLHQGYNLNA